MKGRVIAGIIALAVVLALVGGYLFSKSRSGPTVSVATVARQDLNVTVSAPGSLEAANPAGVFPRTEGRIAQLHVRQGQQVRAGDKLATLDRGPLRDAVRAAESSLAQARAMPTATRRLRAARNAAIDAAKSALKTAKVNLGRAVLKAPSDGVVQFVPIAEGSTRTVQRGSFVTPAVPVFEIVRLTGLVFNAQVDEADIARVKTKQQVQLTLDAFPGQRFAGKVREVRPAPVTTSTGGIAFAVIVSLDASKSRLFPGMSGDVDVRVSAVADALSVPISAIVSEGGKSYVFKLGADNVVTRTEIRVGAATDAAAQVLSGLAEGDRVAIGQLSGLADGTKVNVT